jgi:glycosyltransferase involved in cell wall biosynthesis
VDTLIGQGILHINRPVASKNPGVIFDNGLWLTDFARAEKVDIIHARSRAPGWSAYMAARRAPCAFVTTFHAAYKFSNPFKKFYNSVMARGERIIAISEFIGRSICNDYGVRQDKVRIIPRGIDLESYARDKVSPAKRAELLERWKIAGNPPIILMPARISPIKGHKVLIEAMALLAGTPHRNAVAVLIGDAQGRDNYKSELNHLVDQRRLRDSIRIVPPCDDMPAAYSLAALVAAPSLVAEGFGRVPVEAMAMGVPVVASDLGGFSENIRAGITGWLVPPRNPQKLADALLDILGHAPEQREAIIAAALKEARTRYDKRRMVADTLAVYDEVMVGRKA